ncbi:porin family protein [Flavobacterium limicola]|nr:porin family protein [Flavobacterium limicola]
MKKIILTVAAVFAFGFANAQETKFGVKGGVNFANLSGDIEDNSAKVGFNVGGFVEIKVSDKFSVQPELLFSTQGTKFEYSETFDGSTINYQEKANLSYLNIPVMAKYYVATGFSLEAGPQIGFLTSAKYKVEANGEEEEVDAKDDFESIDFGVNFGAGYDFTENLSAGLRYNVGLSNIAKDSGNDKISNSVFSVSLGYKF